MSDTSATDDLDLMNTSLRSERLGPLPLVNAYIDRLGLDALLERFVPSSARVKLPYAKALGMLLRSLLVEREPIYRQAEMVATFAAGAFGLTTVQARDVSDDAVGRALDRLFDADRGGLLTSVVVSAVNEFDLKLGELHNDSTTINFTGQYQQAVGRDVRGRQAPYVTRGFNKDHRPDLKQLLFILTTTADGGVPVQFRCANGNQNDSTTHETTWDALASLVGYSDFLYVADSKLCSREAMDHIHKRGGRFVTVMPRSRLEDREFRSWIIKHEPDWQLVRDEPHPNLPEGPRSRVSVHRHHLPSSEGWPITWVSSTNLALKQQNRRHERIARAAQQLDDLAAKLAGPKPRMHAQHDIHERVDDILSNNKVKRYVTYKLEKIEQHEYKQAKRGRPGPNTQYQRVSKDAWRLTWQVDDAAITDAHASDGMYPLLSNDPNLNPTEVLAAHERQPVIEKRFQYTKDTLEIAPAFLKNEGRIEALFYLYFLALLIATLIERELRRAMNTHHIHDLPLYPEERTTTRPTAEQILKLYAHVQRHTITHGDHDLHTYQPQLTNLQQHILELLSVPTTNYQTPTPTNNPQ